MIIRRERESVVIQSLNFARRSERIRMKRGQRAHKVDEDQILRHLFLSLSLSRTVGNINPHLLHKGLLQHIDPMRLDASKSGFGSPRSAAPKTMWI
jgi:hypothetical protein